MYDDESFISWAFEACATYVLEFLSSCHLVALLPNMTVLVSMIVL